MNTNTRHLIAELRDAPYHFGPAVMRGTGHYQLTHPNGQSIVIPATTSDWRSRLNNLAEAARIAGIKQRKPNAGHYRHVRTPKLDWTKVMDERSTREQVEASAEAELNACEARLRQLQLSGRRPDAEAIALAKRIVKLRRVLDPFSTATSGDEWAA